MKLKLYVRRAALVAGAAVLGVSGCKRDSGQAGAPQGRPPATVVVAAAQTRDVPIYIDEIGRTVASEFVNIMPQVTGQVQSIHFTDGANVKKGDVLFTIDPRAFEAALGQAEANVAQQQAALELARQEFKRVQGLVETRAISQEAYDQRRNAVAVAEAQLKAGEAAVRVGRLNLEYCTIRSPIDGRAGQRQADPGNIVKANEISLVTVQRLSPIYADFMITERELPRVRQRMAGQSLKVEVSVPNQPASTTQPATQPAVASQATPPSTLPTGDASRLGQLTFLDSGVMQGMGSVRLRATLENDDRFLWPGQFVNTRLVLDVLKDAVLVPHQAVQIGQAGPFVYVVTPQSTADMRKVVEGQRQGDMVVIASGVKAGERVIVNGQTFIGPGAPVQVKEGAAAQ